MLDFWMLDSDLFTETGVQNTIPPDEGWFVISIGGDGNFIRSSHAIRDNITPLIGVNSDPMRSSGFLSNFKFEFNEKTISSDLENFILVLKSAKPEDFFDWTRLISTIYKCNFDKTECEIKS